MKKALVVFLFPFIAFGADEPTGVVISISDLLSHACTNDSIAGRAETVLQVGGGLIGVQTDNVAACGCSSYPCTSLDHTAHRLPSTAFPTLWAKLAPWLARPVSTSSHYLTVVSCCEWGSGGVPCVMDLFLPTCVAVR